MNKTLHTIAAVALLSGCTMMDCVEDNGEVVDRSLDVNDFDGVALDLMGEMRLVPGDEFSVQLRGASNILDLVEVEVKDGICHLRKTKCYSSNTGVKAVITMPSLSHVELSGSGNIEVAPGFSSGEMMLLISGSGDINGTIQSGELIARINGSGDMNLRGASGTMEVEIEGSGDVRAADLSTGKCLVSIDGSGNAYVRVSQELDVSIDGSGDVIYSGEPTIEQDIDGSGELRKARKKAA